MDRPDLGALFAHVTRRLVDAETPILAAHALTMWEYVALSALEREAAPTQLVLARTIRYDKTRLIALLDGLETRGLVTRHPDPADRRARVVSLTADGVRVLAEARTDIRAMEEGVLGELDAAERTVLLRALPRLAEPA
ncbi:MarR family winged helix-turn-helix transcriptional regulator [Luteimicrobium album]|uniref:MarR family winged helix-turn-helix transcriptional regulator n=1 Tax=Luteimicrobium album TaxID=1054550 RepID=UPI0024E09454|nr:MarR family winged helix-turn-helix transcriptional regulator [Luteimicrobium album]